MSKLVDISFVEYELPLSTERVVVALVQLEGPFPNGKHFSVIGSRQTFAWRELADMDARVAKAVELIHSLYKLHPEINVFIFPEYTIPVEHALQYLRPVSQQTGAIIVLGADATMQRTGEIYVQSYVILPDREPVAVTKTNLSKWEHGYVDVPPAVINPIFTWKVGESRYSLTIFLSADLLLAATALKGLPRVYPGLIVAPMCSSDMDIFLMHADYLLPSGQGMAVLLANCVGEGACGRSAVHAVTANNTALQPTVELPAIGEAAAVCEIRCNYLALPRKTPSGSYEALGKRHVYNVYTIRAADGTVSVSLVDNAARERQRAVLNPALFDISGKKMRMAFLSVDEFTKVAESVRNANFEVLAILGQHDIAVTHLHQNRYDLIVDIKQRIPTLSIGRLGSDTGSLAHDDSETFPHFEVEVFHKVMGVPISDEERGVFKRAEPQFPTTEELVRIMALGNDWHAPGVTDGDRDSFLKHRWIISTTEMQAGQIDAIMTIHLNHAGAGITGLLTAFTDRVLPVLASKRQVTSIYRGTGHSIGMHFVLRLTSSRDQLFDLIEEIHRLATREKILIATTTYLVMKKLSALDVAAACLSESLPPKEAYYWDSVVIPLLSAEELERTKQIPVMRRSVFISTLTQLQRSIQEIANKPWANRREELLKRAAVGLLFDDVLAVRDLHNLLQDQVEKILTEMTLMHISEGELDEWRQLLTIPAGKSLKNLTYTERIKILMHICTLGRLGAPWTQELSGLMTNTTQVRNAFSHGRTHELDEPKVVAAVKTYASFLADK